jgi:hypothetical protein
MEKFYLCGACLMKCRIQTLPIRLVIKIKFMSTLVTVRNLVQKQNHKINILSLYNRYNSVFGIMKWLNFCDAYSNILFEQKKHYICCGMLFSIPFRMAAPLCIGQPLMETQKWYPFYWLEGPMLRPLLRWGGGRWGSGKNDALLNSTYSLNDTYWGLFRMLSVRVLHVEYAVGIMLCVCA